MSGRFQSVPTQGIALRNASRSFADNEPGNQDPVCQPDLRLPHTRYTDDQGAGGLRVHRTLASKGLSIGPGCFPLMRVSFGIVRNTRPCDGTTEFGIESQVWNQASGLCNFGPLPKPKAMRQADKRGDGITSGTMNTYFTAHRKRLP